MVPLSVDGDKEEEEEEEEAEEEEAEEEESVFGCVRRTKGS